MQFLVKFVAAIVPYLLRFMDKHSDEYLEALSKRIIDFIGGNVVATVKFRVINSQGEPVANSVAGFSLPNFGQVFKKADGNVIYIQGFKEGKHTFEVSADGYEKEKVEIEIEDPNVVIDKTIVLR